jgi:trimeric autotransporter adhesin
VLALGAGQIQATGQTELFAAGQFTSIGGITAPRVARFNGTNWIAMPGIPSNGVEGSQVLDIALVPTGFGFQDLYIAGQFQHGIRRYAFGTWVPVGPSLGFNNTVDDIDAIPVAPGVWNLFAGGALTHISGLPVWRAAQWNGQQWIQLPEGGFDGRVTAIGGSSGGGTLRLQAAGEFTATQAGTPAPGVALLEDSTWSGVSAFDRAPQFVAAQVDPVAGGAAILIGGDFTSSPAADGFLARIAACPAGFSDLFGCQPAPLDLLRNP